MNGRILILALSTVVLLVSGCKKDQGDMLQPKISIVNAPNDIVTLGADFIAEQVNELSDGKISPRVFHSGVLSGGRGQAEIEMCRQGSIEIHVTSTAYLAHLVPKTSIVSLPFLFRDMVQVINLVTSDSPSLAVINKELNEKGLHVIAWWPRGFRQLTNSKRPIEQPNDLEGLTLRVMNNQLYVDNMNAIGANPVPMEWGEVYNALQLHTIDGQENAEDVIHANKLFEAQDYMTIWDYSTDFEIVMVNIDWWEGLLPEQREIIQEAADASVIFQAELLENNTNDLRQKIEEAGMEISYLGEDARRKFRKMVEPVWLKYEAIFTPEFMKGFLSEIEKY
ncbi:MAG: TRAP transporter substrate-binding protein [Bacteroidetes bacterium]|nr:TRAP transporter substrate-binding protein [Bacteroidota bacterium]MDA1118984.1 TRAP transporter substrate-binding protein [Bacteroidota bacterium]